MPNNAKNEYQYDFIHVFTMGSKIFNLSTVQLIKKVADNFRNLFVFRYEEEYLAAKEIAEDIVLNKKVGDIEEIKVIEKLGRYIVIHGLIYENNNLVKLMVSQAERVIRCVWGSDIYHVYKYNFMLYKLVRKIYRMIMGNTKDDKKAAKVISSFAAIAVGFKGDYFEIRKRYGRNVPIYSALYPMGYYLEDLEKWREAPKQHDYLNVLIGHSAYRFLHHKKYLKKLRKYGKRVKIYLPLSYGNMSYVTEVKTLATKLYDRNQLVIIEDMRSAETYFKLLCQIDVAIFDFEHQAAYGNMLLLMYLNKKIYLSTSGVMYRGFQQMGLEVDDAKKIGHVDLFKLKDPPISKNNVVYATRQLDLANIENDWKKMFNELMI